MYTRLDTELRIFELRSFKLRDAEIPGASPHTDLCSAEHPTWETISPNELHLQSEACSAVPCRQADIDKFTHLIAKMGEC